MISTRLLLPAMIALAPTLSSSVAFAQDEEDPGTPKEGARARAEEKPVREIVRGFYADAAVGGAMFLGQLRGTVDAGTYSSLASGQDFVDSEKLSLAWEVSLSQGVHNGLSYDLQGQLGGPYIEGDIRTYIATGGLEASFYPARRFGVGVKAGGGVLFAPLLMVQDYYNSDVVTKAWHGADGGFHNGPHPIVRAGPTFEYYTKLAHFSLGADANFFYALTFDFGADFTGYMKYTF
jgi:hypothetical protein